MKKIYVYIMLAVGALTMQSCLHDNDDVFDKPAAERIDEAVASAKTLLQSAENGWKFEYYLGSDYSYGGYNMLVKFGADGKAHLSSEIAASDSVSSSSWDVTKDQGPVLTFNTYNTLLHELTQPYQDEVNGYEGDYEFIIMKTTQDTIYLQGKKWGNNMRLTRAPQDLSWTAYLDSIGQVRDNFIYLYQAVIGDSVSIALDTDRQFKVTTATGEELTSQFIFTTTGIKLRAPLTVNGITLQNLTYHKDASDIRQSVLTTADGALTLEGNVPATFQLFDDLKGSYRITANGSSAIITFKPEQSWQGKQFTAEGLVTDGNGENVDVTLSYDPVFGQLQLAPQYLGLMGNYAVYMLAWAIDPATGSGSISTAANAAVKLVWNQNMQSPSYTFEPVGSFKTNSFILYLYGNEGWEGAASDWKFTASSSGDYRLAYLSSLVKL